MVTGPAEHGIQTDVIFVIEGTAVNGAYLNDLKTNYVIPTLEYVMIKTKILYKIL